jgi:6-phosphofructokinase 1
MKIFLSYKFDHERFIQRVSYYLNKQEDIQSFCYADERKRNDWPEIVEKALKECGVFVFLVGEKFGDTQEGEALRAQELGVKHKIVVNLPKARTLTVEFSKFKKCDPIVIKEINEQSAQACAKDIVQSLGMEWGDPLGIPLGYPFEYEKDIIERYVNGKGRLSGKEIELGCPESWPSIENFGDSDIPNPVPVEMIGGFREEEARIFTDVRSKFHCPGGDDGVCLQNLTPEGLTLLEAGPRANLRYPKQTLQLRVGILTSGGIAPGINAVISGIVERHSLYAQKQNEEWKRRGMEEYGLEIYGYRDGFKALLRPGRNFITLDSLQVREQANFGGSILSTSRADELMDASHPDERERKFKNLIHRLKDDDIDILYVIGGDGSMRAAHAIRKTAIAKKIDLSVVAIPKTMDNDILWVWQSFGFLSVVEKAKEFILQLHTEARSNPRLCVIQLFGSDSGFVVSHAALASGVCDLALIPEVEFSMKKVSAYIRRRLQSRYKPGRGGESPYGVIVMAETAIPTDVKDYMDDPDVNLDEEEKKEINAFLDRGKRVFGQTPDALRTGGLKIVARTLQRDIINMGDRVKYWKEFRVFRNEPRHLLRSIRPSVSDVIFGHRLGSLAVDNAMAGYTDFMVSQWLTEFVLVPLELVILGRKRVPRNGIFWKSVLSSTGQPASLV